VVQHENVLDEIDQFEMEPFLTLLARGTQVTSQIQELEDQEQEFDPDEMTALRKQRNDIRSEAVVACIERETKLAQEHFQNKGLKIFSASAREYLR
jgi:uncharacterized protein YdcH (DUF465 family)